MSKGIPLLSPREKQLLRRFAAGRTDVAIAMELGDRESRIAAQRKRLIEKLQIHSDEQLVTVANQFASWPKGPMGMMFSPTERRHRE